MKDWTFAWKDGDLLRLETMQGKVWFFLQNSDGFEKVEKLDGSNYKFYFGGKVYDSVPDLLQNSKVKKLLRKRYKEILDGVKKAQQSLPYAEKSYSRDKREIQKKIDALKVMKKYI